MEKGSHLKEKNNYKGLLLKQKPNTLSLNNKISGQNEEYAKI